MDGKGRALVSDSLETNRKGVYVIGDGLFGPSLVVKGMANAIKVAESILGMEISGSMAKAAREEEIYAKKGILAEPGQKEADRCLSCSTVCENCVDVCPNLSLIHI